MIQSNTVARVSIPPLAFERNGGRPIYEQLRAAIELAIVTGEIPDGAPLPAVRELAAAQGVSPNTVVRAYRDLEAEGVLRAVPKRGYFVIGAGDAVPNAAHATVRELVDEALDAALAGGMDASEFLLLVAERVRERKRARRVVAVAGYAAAMGERTQAFADAIADLGVDVVPIAYEEMERLGPEALDDKLANAEWILVPVLETRLASGLLGRYAGRIMPFNRVVRDDTKEFIRKQPGNTRFGIISGADDLVSRTVASVARLHPFAVPPISASIEDAAGVERVIRNADVLVIGSIARPYLATYAPLPVPSVELVYLPDAAALRRLRARLNGAAKEA